MMEADIATRVEKEKELEGAAIVSRTTNENSQLSGGLPCLPTVFSHVLYLVLNLGRTELRFGIVSDCTDIDTFNSAILTNTQNFTLPRNTYHRLHRAYY